jgi:hypothetical protein
VLFAPLTLGAPGLFGLDWDLLGRILGFFTYAGAFVLPYQGAHTWRRSQASAPHHHHH